MAPTGGTDERLPDDIDRQEMRGQLRDLAIEYGHTLLERQVPWGDATALDRVVRDYQHALGVALHELDAVTS